MKKAIAYSIVYVLAGAAVIVLAQPPGQPAKQPEKSGQQPAAAPPSPDSQYRLGPEWHFHPIYS